MFKITYYAKKYKKIIQRLGKHDDDSREYISKDGRKCYCYFDLEKNGYRTATDTWKIEEVA